MEPLTDSLPGLPVGMRRSCPLTLQLILQDTLPPLYPDPNSIRRILARTGLNPARIPIDHRADNTWYFAILEAIHQHKLPTLITEALSDYPHDKYLNAAFSML